jgi:SAM-dependent methyltransferase
MVNLSPIHLCITQPGPYVHSLGFLDQARYFRHQFRRFGAEVTMAKNRLRHDAVNFIFGAHLGFEPGLRQRHSCVFVNLEQLGEGGAQVSPAYLKLLATSAVVDYDARNVPVYAASPEDVMTVPFLHAPYLQQAQPMPLADRPIDLLFFGSMNAQRQALIARIEACGRTVSVFDRPLYGPERDQFIVQAKAVLNIPFYETSRFEQARVSHCLSLGTPVVSLRRECLVMDPAFEDSVLWFDEPAVPDFFGAHMDSPAFLAQAEAAVARFRQTDPMEAYADLLAFAQGFGTAHQRGRPSGPWQPTQVNLGSGKDYKPGWLNLDVLARAMPDAVLDLGQTQSFPQRLGDMASGPIELAPGSLDLVYANNVLEHVPDLPMLMGNVLTLLKEGGVFEIEVPYEHAPTAWQDPTHLRALNEKSWLYYTDWFWYLGWFEHRFEIARFNWLDLQLQACEHGQAAFMKISLRKVATTPAERTTARTMQADFGGLDDDEWLPSSNHGFTALQEAALT